MKNLLESLTIEEKIRLLTGKGVWHTDTANVKLKSVLMMDGPQGLRLAPDSLESPAHGMNEEDLKKVEPTIMPSEFNLANTWDKDLVYLNGQTIAEDCIDFNVDILLAPGISIKRTPLCGRNFEYFSEDPYLAGEMGKAYVLGVQSKGVGTSLKHFCLNNREHDRFSLNSVCEERVMREIYFPAFKKTLEAKPYSIMSSYNRVNGTYMAENKELLDDLLKKRVGV